MKVVLFCGGLGTRMREYSETIPKPMVDIGYRPIIWHLMKYYSHFGHNDFILCLGYRGDTIRNYFLNYNECVSNDFTLSNGGKSLQLYSSDIADWKITFVDTGLNSNIGQRLQAVQKYLDKDELFMANYADGLTDLNLHQYVDYFCDNDKVASFVSVKSSQSFHVVSADDQGLVTKIISAGEANLWINGGFFVFKKQIFDYIRPGEELVHEPFKRLMNEKQLITYKHDGFWACMDTFKEKQAFDNFEASGTSPWALWKKNGLK
jgi:glucose-1-phosphate cytidylyltransferase